MADIANTYPENIAGKYFVDNQCIDCDLCRETAPNNFTRNDDGGYSYVFKQPSNEDEEKSFSIIRNARGQMSAGVLLWRRAGRRQARG
jgi:ferredoxin